MRNAPGSDAKLARQLLSPKTEPARSCKVSTPEDHAAPFLPKNPYHAMQHAIPSPQIMPTPVQGGAEVRPLPPTQLPVGRNLPVRFAHPDGVASRSVHIRSQRGKTARAIANRSGAHAAPMSPIDHRWRFSGGPLRRFDPCAPGGIGPAQCAQKAVTHPFRQAPRFLLGSCPVSAGALGVEAYGCVAAGSAAAAGRRFAPEARWSRAC
jgi:hypothetical protein